MAKKTFKQTVPKAERIEQLSRLREKYPDRIPVICEKNDNSDIPDIDKNKFLVPADLTVGQFQYVVRKRINISSDKALFVFCQNSIMTTSNLISTVYESHKDPEDGYLYITYSGESTFGTV